MKRAFAAAALCSALAVSGAAEAQDASSNAGRFGVGADGSLASITGLSAKFQVAESIGLQAILGLDVVSPGGDAESYRRLGLALRGSYRLFTNPSGAIGFVFGIDIANASQGEAGGTDFALEGGLQGEWFVTPNVSFHTEVGLTINLLADELSSLEPLPGALSYQLDDSTVIVLGAGDVLALAGFTFWFD